MPKSKIKSKTKEIPGYNLAKIKVIGIGGAGCNAISRMIGILPRAIEIIAINTDLQDLNCTPAKKKIQIGRNITKGLGTGMNPDLGRQAAEENHSEIAEVLQGADMIFITGGLGGGTCTGAAPIVAEIAKEMGILTVAVVTKPFTFEGTKRNQIAEEGAVQLRDRVDTIIFIPNDRILSLIDKNTSLMKAFEAIDEILKNSVLGITELITIPGTINIDFADVKAIMEDGGPAIMGIGVASGSNRSLTAAKLAVNSPLLENSLEGAKAVLLNIAGHRDLKMSEVNEIAKLVAESADAGARIIFGTHYDRKLRKGQIKVLLIATGFDGGGLSRGSQVPTGLFTSKINEVRKESEEEKPQNLKEFTLFEKKNGLDKFKRRSKEEVWDIPAFLRKKRRKSH
jgi:cell division protein FtsZ